MEETKRPDNREKETYQQFFQRLGIVDPQVIHTAKLIDQGVISPIKINIQSSN